ncbi:hypothetical protein ACHAXA_000448 [Cyclostephanos tholiformis]|uniref:PI-PLC Y-box domain-containing protein n=1 Tax=Cyclostephanos tholiformis TaxID=382380 RepID=A0ABD3RVZ8_9STRA
MSKSNYFAGSFVLVLPAFILFVIGYAFYECDFIRYTNPASGTRVYRGIWTYPRVSDGYCVEYPQGTDLDSSWVSARVFWILGCVVGVLSIMLNLPACFTERSRIVSALGPGWMMTSVSFGLTFLQLNSDVCKENGGCGISKFAYFLIPGIVLSSLASLVCFRAYAEQKNEVSLGLEDSVAMEEPFLSA